MERALGDGAGDVLNRPGAFPASGPALKEGRRVRYCNASLDMLGCCRD